MLRVGVPGIGARRWTVRARILTAILLVAALGMAVAGGMAFLVHQERTLQAVDARLLSRSDSALFALSEARDAEGGEAAITSSSLALRTVIARVIPNRHESTIGIINGEPAYVPGVRLDFTLADNPEFIAAVLATASDSAAHLASFESPARTIRYVVVPITVPGDDEAGLYVTAVDVDAELAELNEAFGTFIGVAALALGAIGFVGWFVAGRLLRPIRQLQSAASRITVSQRNERILVVGRDDVSDLGRTVNDMLDRLDAALTGQRQLLDDVRHELRTPITIIRGHLELLDSHQPADVAATRALAIEELDRMSGLVDDIELLTESESVRLALVPTDVADLTRAIFAKASGYPLHRWVLADIAQVTVAVDPARITQAVLQLADNAAKFSDEGTTIEVGSTVVGSRVEFWVSDSGPGIPEGAEGRIFERFGRVGAGRGARGSGLGLPIVKAIAVSHEGDVGLSSTLSGSRFSITVPLTPTADLEAATA